MTDDRRFMNDVHRQFLASDAWGELLERDLLPWLDALGDLGHHLLEIGPGPGRTTDLLRTRVPKLTAVEHDLALVEPLRERMAGTNVDVRHGDATALDLPDATFSTVATFSVLHHVPTPEQQDAVFAEVARVLVPGGRYVASDSRDGDGVRAFHDDDVFNPMPVDTVAARLEAAGLVDVDLTVGDHEIRFHARKP